MLYPNRYGLATKNLPENKTAPREDDIKMLPLTFSVNYASGGTKTFANYHYQLASHPRHSTVLGGRLGRYNKPCLVVVYMGIKINNHTFLRVS